MREFLGAFLGVVIGQPGDQDEKRNLELDALTGLKYLLITFELLHPSSRHIEIGFLTASRLLD